MNSPTQPVKVLRVIARLNVGGPAVHCTSLSRSLAAYGFETVLVTGHPESDEKNFETLFGFKPEGFELVRLGGLRRKVSILGDFKTLFEMISIMRRERPQVVHTHTAKAGVLGRIAAIVTGVPVVVHTFHGHVLSGYFNAPISWAIRQLERSLAWGSSAIVTLSPSLQTELADRFKVAPRMKIRVIPLGRPLEEFFASSALKGRLRRELGIEDPRAVLVGTLGRLVPIKDQRTLIEGFAKVKLDVPSFLIIAGEGDLASELKARAAELGIAHRVKFLGWRSDLATLYADFDVFALSSINEGTPLSIIESFAAGCTVVSTAVGGVADLFSPAPTNWTPGALDIRKEGILIPSRNPELLGQALQTVLGDPDFRQNASAAARLTAAQYTTENLTRRISELYRELIQSSVSKKGLNA